MSDKDLNALITQLAENSRKMDMILARSPEKEYAYREGNVGASNVLTVCPASEGFVCGIDAATFQAIFSSALHVQKWRFDHSTTLDVLAVATATLVNSALRFEFSNDANFNKVVAFFKRYTWATVPSSYTANTGVTVGRLEVEFPIRQRYVRVTAGVFTNAAGGLGSEKFTPGIAQWSNANAVHAHVFGE